MASMELVGPTPENESEFSIEWVTPILKKQLEKEGEIDPDSVNVVEVKAVKNSVQGILSTTFVVDVDFEAPNENGEKELQTKHMFAKVPLKDDPNFASVNIRELVMLTTVLPQMQAYLDSECEGFFKLPMPDVYHCFYDGKGTHDVFVLGNLLAEDYENFDETKDFDEDHLKSLLECLAQLHGTGLAYKRKVGGSHEKLKEEFPGLEQQIQLNDVMENEKIQEFFRQHFRAFLHYLEDTEPALTNHTGYMKKMHKHILKVMTSLDTCGFEKLITICHGDAKPNNFLFRNINIEFDDLDLGEDLDCEGLQSILIDWQGGFVGSVANDLMWSIYPFLEANQDKKAEFYLTALKYYYEQLTVVLESFNSTLDDLGLPNTFPEFASLVKRCLVLEFIVVTVVKPIMMIPEPEKLLKWHKETEKNKIRRFKKKVVKPEYNEVFTSPRFTGFCHLYFKIATALGAFQELGKIYFDVMKDTMFEANINDYDSDIDCPEPDILYRIINAPVPKMPQLVVPKWFGVPNFNLHWRRLKYRKGLYPAIICGLLPIFIGLLLYHNHYVLGIGITWGLALYLFI